MRKLVLAVILCCAFSVYGIAVNSDAKLNTVETIRKRITALRAERADIEHKRSSLYDEQGVAKKKAAILKDKIMNLESNNEAYTVSHFKARIEKMENNIKILTTFIAEKKLRLDINKINLNIDKANIELIKAEIKAGKTPKVPLDVARVLIERNKAWVKVNEATVKIKQMEIKEEEANIKYLENILETGKKGDEIRKNANDSYGYIFNTNIEIAELRVKRAMLILKLEQARRETTQARIKEAQAGAEFSKITHKFCKTFGKINKVKVIDKKNFMLLFDHR
jgi:hypothetical protein